MDTLGNQLEQIITQLAEISTNTEPSFWNAGVITFLTVFLTSLITATGYFISRYQKRTLLRMSLISWFDNNEQAIKDYMKYLKDSYIAIRDNPYPVPPTYINFTISVERIKELPLKDLNDALVQNLQGNENRKTKSLILEQLLSDLNYIECVNKSVLNYLELYTTKAWEYIRQWDSNAQEFTFFFYKLNGDELSERENNLVIKIRTAAEKYINEKEFPPNNSDFATSSRYILELQNILKSFPEEDPVKKEIVIFVDKFVDIYNRLNQNKDYYKVLEQYYFEWIGRKPSKEYPNGLSGIFQRITKAIEFYKGHKIKYIGL